MLRLLLAEAENGRLVGLAFCALNANGQQFEHQVLGEMPALQTLGMLEYIKNDIIRDLRKSNHEPG